MSNNLTNDTPTVSHLDESGVSDPLDISDLRVTIVQSSLVWHDPEANRALLAEKLRPLQGQTDLVVLPEMFTSGFTVNPEPIGKQQMSTEWMLDQAHYLGATVTGSLAFEVDTQEKGVPQYVNRLLFATPNGELYHYDKVHLFRMGDEHKRYQSGGRRCIVNLRGWRILLTVCYDLRFPVFCRNRNDYDLMVCVANWPAKRRSHWCKLLDARAIENQAYVAGVNRVGRDGNDLDYSGDSVLVDFLGDHVIDGEKCMEWEKTATLSYQALTDYRQRFPAWQDADVFSLHLDHDNKGNIHE